MICYSQLIPLKSARVQDNEEQKNKENENVGKLNLSVPYCSNCRLECTPKIYKNCFTSAYCGEICKRNHRSKHETICKVLRKKSSYLITSMKRVEYDITQEVEGNIKMTRLHYSIIIAKIYTDFYYENFIFNSLLSTI